MQTLKGLLALYPAQGIVILTRCTHSNAPARAWVVNVRFASHNRGEPRFYHACSAYLSGVSPEGVGGAGIP